MGILVNGVMYILTVSSKCWSGQKCYFGMLNILILVRKMFPVFHSSLLLLVLICFLCPSLMCMHVHWSNKPNFHSCLILREINSYRVQWSTFTKQTSTCAQNTWQLWMELLLHTVTEVVKVARIKAAVSRSKHRVKKFESVPNAMHDPPDVKYLE